MLFAFSDFFGSKLNSCGKVIPSGLVLPGRPTLAISFAMLRVGAFHKTDNDFCMNGVTLKKKLLPYYFFGKL